MLPRQNVTIRKCTIQNVTDPKLFCLKPKICAKVCKKKSRKSYANFEHTLWSFRVNTTSFISCM